MFNRLIHNTTQSLESALVELSKKGKILKYNDITNSMFQVEYTISELIVSRNVKLEVKIELLEHILRIFPNISINRLNSFANRSILGFACGRGCDLIVIKWLVEMLNFDPLEIGHMGHTTFHMVA